MNRVETPPSGAAPAPASSDAPDRNGRRLLHQATVDRVRDMIFSGELAPGARVPEVALCAQLGVSRTPLREAFKVLATEGLLELLPNRGARVARLSAAQLDEMFPVMATLEALAGELACERITDEQIAEVRVLHYQMALHHTRGELDDYFRLNQRIHEKIMAIAGNPTLAQLSSGLAARIRRARYLANISRPRWDQAMAEHEQILAALARRDGPTLARVLRGHLMNKCQVLKESILAMEPDRG